MNAAIVPALAVLARTIQITPPSPRATRVLPLPQLASRHESSAVYGLAAVDCHGRLADRDLVRLRAPGHVDPAVGVPVGPEPGVAPTSDPINVAAAANTIHRARCGRRRGGAPVPTGRNGGGCRRSGGVGVVSRRRSRVVVMIVSVRCR